MVWCILHFGGFPAGTSGKEPACQCSRHKRCSFNPWVGKTPWRRAWQPTPVFVSGEPHGRRSLAGYQSIGLQRVGHEWSNLAHSTHTDNKVSERGNLKRIPFKIASKKINYLGIKLTKDLKDLKIIQHWWRTLRMMQRSGKIPHALGLGVLILLKWPFYPKTAADIMAISIKMPMTFFRSRSNNLKILWNCKRPWIGKEILRMKE